MLAKGKAPNALSASKEGAGATQPRGGRGRKPSVTSVRKDE